MSVNPLLLTAALPVARGAAQAVVQTAQGIGSQFANLISGSAAESSPDPLADSPPTSPTATLNAFAERLRGWLQDQGIDTSTFQLDLHVATDGTSELQVDGQDADAIRQLLGQHPNWLEALRKAATQLQLPSASLGGSPPPVTVSVSESDWSAAFARTI